MLGFSPLASAPLGSSGESQVNVDLGAAENITAGTPQVGAPFTVSNYATTADGLFDSTQQYYIDIFTNNRGFSTNLTPTTGHVCQSPTTVSNLSVSSAGISFRLSGTKIIQYPNGNWSTDGIYYTDVFLSWTGNTLTATTVTFATQLPSGSGTSYSLNSSALEDAIVAAAAAAGVSNQIYDWIPSEVTVTNSSNVFSSRLAGSTTDRDTFTFNHSTTNGRLNSYYTFGRRFLLQTIAPNQNVSTSPSTSIHFVRFDRAVQTDIVYKMDFDQDHVFDLSFTIGAPSLGSSDIDQEHDLTGNNIVTGNVIYTTSTIDSDHDFTGSNIVCNASSIATPTIEQSHNFDGVDIVNSTSVGSSEIDQHHNLTGSNIETAVPAIGATDIQIEGEFTGTDIATGLPVLGTPDIDQEHDLTLSNITASSTIGASEVFTGTVFTGVSFTTSAPTISTSEIDQHHQLDGNNINSSSVVGSSIIEQEHNFEPSSITASLVIANSNIEQNHSFNGSNILTNAPLVVESDVDEFHDLSGNNIATNALIISSSDLDENHDFAGTDVSSNASVVGSSGIEQEHNLSGNDIASAATIVNDSELTLN